MVLFIDDADKLIKCLQKLRREMVDVTSERHIVSVWHARTKVEFIELGGSWREIRWMTDCLEKNLPQMKSYLFEHLGNGGVRYDNPFMTNMLTIFHVAGFSDDDFYRAVDLAVDEFFVEKRREFAISRRW